jgi:casein kinase I homolog HRR25
MNIINRRNYAIKLEQFTHGISSSLEREAHILEHLSQGSPVGIPRVHWFGHEANYDVVVLDLLGPSLQDIVKTRKKLNRVTVQHIGEQLVSLA